MDAEWPKLNEDYLTEDEIEYPVSFNGKKRFSLKVDANLSKDEIEKAVLEHERTAQQLKGGEPKKIIVVPGRIVNVVH
jgi:leucyl-tRNA synthetase